MHMHLVHYEIFDVKLLNIYVCAIKFFNMVIMVITVIMVIMKESLLDKVVLISFQKKKKKTS